MGLVQMGLEKFSLFSYFLFVFLRFFVCFFVCFFVFLSFS